VHFVYLFLVAEILEYSKLDCSTPFVEKIYFHKNCQMLLSDEDVRGKSVCVCVCVFFPVKDH
jgi:hypothetical protein